MKPKKVYLLYTRCSPGREPRTWASVPEYNADGHEIGTVTMPVMRWGAGRGAMIFECNSYKSLVTHAERLAKYIGMPKSRIWDIFDWNN